MLRFLFPGFPAGRIGFGLLVLRLVVGTAFLFHGWPKIQNAMGWMDQPIVPLHVPDVLQAAAAVSEFIGGAALMMDGSVRFTKSSVDGLVWRALGTRAGGEVISADAY